MAAFRPTTLDEREKHFRDQGYVIVPDAVPADYLADLQAATERLAGDPEFRKTHGRNLLASDPVFERMIDGHAGMPLLERLIPDLQLLAMDIRTCPPGGGGMAWHPDIDFHSGEAIVSINTALYLDDLTPTNGALRVLPRSHRTRFDLPESEHHDELPGEVLVQVPAGTMVVFQDTLWHRTGDNRTDRPRRGIFTYYGHFWMKPTGYASNPEPIHDMARYIDGKGPARARLMGRWLDNSEFNRHPGATC